MKPGRRRSPGPRAGEPVPLETKTIALPRLNNLRPTLESTALKLMEEAGELSEAIGKFRALSGERAALEERDVAWIVCRELLDVAQTAITMLFVLEEQYRVDVEAALRAHVQKLLDKGYLVLDPGVADSAGGVPSPP